MELRQHYHSARKRIFLLDYDGTLVGYQPTPPEATPTPAALEVLGELADDPLNTVVVVSGRDHLTLESWLGHLPIGLIAEHGLFVRPEGGSWHATTELNQDWKASVLRLMQTAAVHGSEIEEKAMSLVWHYRQCKPEAGAAAAKRLITDIQMHADAGLNVMHGNKIVEVTASGTDKGQAAREWLEKGHYDFILAAGDDTTDEDLFRALPADAFTIKVGHSTSHADTTIGGPEDMLRLLKGLAS